MRLGPLDEVRHDQEVAGKAHLLDDADFALQARPVVLLRIGQLDLLQAGLQPFPRLPGQFLGFVTAGAGIEARQDRVDLVDQEGAPLGNLDGIVAGFRQVGEQVAHLLGGPEPMVRRDAAAILDTHEGTVGNAQKRLVRPVEFGAGKIDVVGGDQRHVLGIGVFDKGGFGRGAPQPTLALQFDIETIAEGGVHGVQRRLALVHPALAHGHVHRPVRPAGQKDQAFIMFSDLIPGDMRLLHIVAVDKGDGGQSHQILVAGRVLHQYDDGRDTRPLFRRQAAKTADRQGATDDRLDAIILAVGRKFQGAEEIATVGNTDGGHTLLGGQLGDIGGLDRPLEQRIGRTHPQMDKILAHGGLSERLRHQRRLKPSTPGDKQRKQSPQPR